MGRLRGDSAGCYCESQIGRLPADFGRGRISERLAVRADRGARSRSDSVAARGGTAVELHPGVFVSRVLTDDWDPTRRSAARCTCSSRKRQPIAACRDSSPVRDRALDPTRARDRARP